MDVVAFVASMRNSTLWSKTLWTNTRLQTLDELRDDKVLNSPHRQNIRSTNN